MGIAEAMPQTSELFTFFGYGDNDEAVRQQAAAVAIRHGVAQAPVLDRAIYLPVTTPDDGNGPQLRGGLLTADGDPVATMFLRRKGQVIDGGIVERMHVTPEVESDEEVVDIGWFIGHYGHMLTEGMARIWYLDEVDPSLKVVFHQRGASAPRGVVRGLLNLFGVSLERCMVVDRPTRFRRVHAPEALLELDGAVHPRFIAPFTSAAQRVARTTRVSQQPVYLSRRLLQADRRRIVGESELEEALRESGFLIVHPETMSLEDQIHLVNEHEHIVSPLGSAAHTILFCLNNPHLHLLTHIGMTDAFFQLSALRDVPTSYVLSVSRPTRGFSGAHAPGLLDIGTVLAYLDAQGMLAKGVKARYQRRVEPIEQQYEEAVLYGLARIAIDRERSLAADQEARLAMRAQKQWPLAWIYACYLATHHTGRGSGILRAFICAAREERDPWRLAHYRGDVERLAPGLLAACDTQLARDVVAALEKTFAVTVSHQG